MTGRSAFRAVFAIFIAALLLGTMAAYASPGPSITALAIDPQIPTTLYAGTSDRGVFKSVDAGATWSLTGLVGIPVVSLAIEVENPGTVYAGTRGGGVFRFKSADDGGIWVAINTGLPDPYVTAVVIEPFPATTLYAVVPNHGVFKSTNRGDTWISFLRNDEPSLRSSIWYEDVMIYTLVSAPALEPATPATLYAGVGHSETGATLETFYWGEVVKSTDAGSKWPSIGPKGWNTVLGRLLAVAPPTATGPATVYSASLFDSELCWTSDDGATFACARITDTSALVSSIVVDPQNPRTIYAGTSLGVYKSEDHAASWKPLNRGLTDTLEAYGVTTSIATLAIAAQTSTILYAGTDVGLFETVDSTEIWTRTGLFQKSLLKSVTLDPAHVEGGDTSTGTVALVSAAPEGGLTLALSSSDTGRATVPATVTVAAGATSTTFLVSTSPVTFGSEVIISAAFADAERNAGLAVTIPIRVGAVSLLPNVVGGSPATGWVYLNAFPMGNVVVTLSSNDPAVEVPASVTFTAWSERMEFMVSTSSVAVPTAVTISATYAGETSSFVVAVNPANFFSSLTLNPASVRGGSESTGTVTLSAAALKPVRFQLGSRDSLATVPSSVIVPAGSASANFVVSTNPVYIYSSIPVQISAYIIDGGSIAKYVTLDVTGPPIPLVAVGLNPDSVRGGSSSTAWVTIGAGAPAAGMTIVLSSSNTAVATVPATVTVPAMTTSAGVTVFTNQVNTASEVTISATSGGVTKSAVLTVNPAADIAAPDTSVTSVVDGDGTPLANGSATLSTVATIAFAGTDNIAVAGFECSLDGASFTSCSSPSKRSGLAVGKHNLKVAAVDTSNNRDGTPVLYTWFVDSPPETTITSAVDRNGQRIPNGGTIRSNPITFRFTATDNLGVKAFECSLDGATFAVCVSPTTYTGAGRGSHTFRVRAVDTKGFRDATPASFAWKR